MVEYLLSSSFRHEIQTRFSHVSGFDDFPDQVYFMMILDVCNSSTVLDIDGSEKSFQEMTLSDFQGENFSSLDTSALKYIKIIEGGYALPRNISSSLIKKATTPSCEYFNRMMYNHLDKVKDMEKRYMLKDPKLLRADPSYSLYGPIGFCEIFQEEYRKLFSEREWLALQETIPQGNIANVKETVVKNASNATVSTISVHDVRSWVGTSLVRTTTTITITITIIITITITTQTTTTSILWDKTTTMSIVLGIHFLGNM